MKLAPPLLSDDGSARIGPVLLPTIVIPASVNALIEPVAVPIVAELEVNDAEPKLARVVSLQLKMLQSAGLSTIHSAEDLWAPETVADAVFELDPSMIVAANSFALDE